MQEDRHVTWRLTVPPTWGGRGDRAWLPANHTEGWRRVFASEDFAAGVLRQDGSQLPWRTAAEATSLLSSVLVHYRLQLQIAEEEAARCQHAGRHLAALEAASRGAEPPARTHPAGAWHVRALVGGAPVLLGSHPSVHGAEGEAAARRTGNASLACWAEPDTGPAPPAQEGPGPGWEPRVDPEIRRVAFAVEDAVAALCAAAATGGTGPDVLDVDLLCLLGEVAHRSILEYRTLLAALWTEMDTCPHAQDHERRSERALAACTHPGDDGPAGAWRHLVLVGDSAAQAVEFAVYRSQAAAGAAVAVARATDELGTYWAEPVMVGKRPTLDQLS